MILIGLGANLPSERGAPQATLAAALEVLEAEGVRVLARSRWYRSAPVPVSDQPWYVNAVASVAVNLGPAELLQLLHRVEARFGRQRRTRNEARPIDLDLIDFDGLVLEQDGLILPHPRLHERVFVLRPLAELAPGWRHPRLGRTVVELIAALPPEATAEPMPPE